MNVIFDLDGTLTDPAKGVVGCIRHALAAFRLGVPERCELERFIGPPLQDAFCELLAVDRESKEVREAVAAYRERFAAIGMFENSVYEGIPEALASLVTRGARLFVATSKPRVFAERILSHFCLAEYFDAVYGSELNGELSEKTELIAYALANSGLRPTETVMVGDRRHDVIGASANQVAPAAVLWGYGSREELIAAGADKLLEEPRELEQIVA